MKRKKPEILRRIQKILIIKRIRANSLSITIIIALIISLLSSLLVLQAYQYRSIQLKYFLDDKLNNNLRSGISICLADTSQYTNDVIKYMDLFGDKDDSVMIKRIPWGIYQVGICKVWGSTKEKITELLIGSSLPPYLKGCLYLVDHDRPISLVGNTRLIGNAFLPKSGARISFINQNRYNGVKLVYGDISSSDKESPSLSDNTVQYLGTLLYSTPREISEYSLSNFSDTNKRKFVDTLQYFYQPGKITLSNVILSGHIIVKSDSLIEIENSATLQNIIVIAPIVKVNSGFKGRLQILASESISVDESCFLQYPSALILIKKEKGSALHQPKVIISKNCTLEGGIFSFSASDDVYKTSVEIKDGCTLKGILFVNGYLTLESDVKGTVLTDYILYRSAASTYENHLVDRRIDRAKLSTSYVGPSIFPGKKINKTIQCLN